MRVGIVISLLFGLLGCQPEEDNQPPFNPTYITLRCHVVAGSGIVSIYSSYNSSRSGTDTAPQYFESEVLFSGAGGQKDYWGTFTCISGREAGVGVKTYFETWAKSTISVEIYKEDSLLDIIHTSPPYDCPETQGVPVYVCGGSGVIAP